MTRFQENSRRSEEDANVAPPDPAVFHTFFRYLFLAILPLLYAMELQSSVFGTKISIGLVFWISYKRHAQLLTEFDQIPNIQAPYFIPHNSIIYLLQYD